MNFLRLLPAAALLAGCAVAPGQDEENFRDVLKDPNRIHGFFVRKIRDREPGIAAQVTSLDSNQFVLGVNNQVAPDLTRRILLGFEQHDLKRHENGQSATARWCNKEFGISRDFKLTSKHGGKLWQLEITREQIEELAQAGLAWFRRQREAADGRIYAYPPDWVAANVSVSCSCGR